MIIIIIISSLTKLQIQLKLGVVVLGIDEWLNTRSFEIFTKREIKEGKLYECQINIKQIQNQFVF